MMDIKTMTSQTGDAMVLLSAENEMEIFFGKGALTYFSHAFGA